MLNYVTLISAGFAMETVLAIVGIPFLPFFLILWIIREQPSFLSNSPLTFSQHQCVQAATGPLETPC